MIEGLSTLLRVTSSQRDDCPKETWGHGGTSDMLFEKLKEAFNSDVTEVLYSERVCCGRTIKLDPIVKIADNET